MKKIFAILFALTILSLPLTVFADCDCRCDFSGCPGDVPPTQRIGNLEDAADCTTNCEILGEAMECTSVLGASCMGGSALPTDTVDEPVTGSDSADLRFEPPLGTTSVQEIIGNVIQAILGIVGSIALLMFVIGGFAWMTAAGNPERVKLGKNIIIWSVIGLVVIFAAYAITRFVITALLQ